VLHTADRDGDIVDHAETLAVIGKSVMEATPDADGDSVFKGLARSEDGTSGGEPEGVHEFQRVGNFELHLFTGRERAGFQFLNVVGFVDEENVFVLGGLGTEEICGRGSFRFQQAITDATVLLGREDVLTDGEVVVVAVDEFEGKHVDFRLLEPLSIDNSDFTT